MIQQAVGFRQILRDPADTSRFVAITSEVSADLGSIGVYESTDAGDSWGRLSSIAAFTAQFAPHGGDVVLGSTDVTVVTPEGQSSSLALSGVLDADDYVTELSLQGETVLVGTLLGHVWSSGGCTAASAPCAWARVQAPVRDALVNVVAGTSAAPNTWFVSGVSADIGVRATSTSGVRRSDDAGETWLPADEGLYPCRLVWRMERDAEGGLLAGLWGGGFARYGAE